MSKPAIVEAHRNCEYPPRFVFEVDSSRATGNNFVEFQFKSGKNFCETYGVLLNGMMIILDLLRSISDEKLIVASSCYKIIIMSPGPPHSDESSIVIDSNDDDQARPGPMFINTLVRLSQATV